MQSEGNSHFLMAVGRHDAGALIEQLDDAISEVLQAVARTGKKGSVGLTLSFEPNGRGVKLGAKVKLTKPELAFGDGFYYADANGRLTRTPPKDELPGLMGIVEGSR